MDDIGQLGVGAAVVVIILREVFSFIKSLRENKSPGRDFDLTETVSMQIRHMDASLKTLADNVEQQTDLMRRQIDRERDLLGELVHQTRENGREIASLRSARQQ